VPNRSDYGEITYRDWFPVAGLETANRADPLIESGLSSDGLAL